MNPFDDASDDLKNLFRTCRAPKKVTDQMQEDGILWPRVSVILRKWALHEPDVQRVTLGYIGKNYSIAVLLDSFSNRGIERVMEQVNNVSRLFNNSLVIAYPLGPGQSDSLLLNSAECHDVYRRKP